MDLLQSICDSLIEMNLTRSGNDFSVSWLDREQAYMRTLKGKNKNPSAEVLVTLFKKLKSKGYELQQSKHDIDQVNSLKLFILADECIKELFGPNFKIIENEEPDLICNFAKKSGIKAHLEVAVSPQEQKFAELIIKECGNFTDPITRRLLFKHFGVEE